MNTEDHCKKELLAKSEVALENRSRFLVNSHPSSKSHQISFSSSRCLPFSPSFLTRHLLIFHDLPLSPTFETSLFFMEVFLYFMRIFLIFANFLSSIVAGVSQAKQSKAHVDISLFSLFSLDFFPFSRDCLGIC